MPFPAKQVFFADYVFKVPENVYVPAEDSFLFAENLAVERGDYVLDIGTGCGILGIVAATNADKVVAVDINPHAIRCAKENAKLNNMIDKLLLIQGDLLSALRTEERFDLILFNAPYLPASHTKDGSWLERAWAGGKNGRQVIDRFICQLPDHMMPDGRILLLQSTLSNLNRTVESFNDGGLKSRIIASQNLPFFESIALIEARHS